MANILDYLDWRGDLTLKQAPFNEVDNLILAELSFLDLHGIVPGPGQGESVELQWAAQQYFERFPDDAAPDMGVLVPNVIPELLRKMAESNRFGTMRLNAFEDRLDEVDTKQFAALAIECGDGTVYLSFRGTDDTITGWKEDFYLACMPEIPAQKEAVDYTEAVAKRYPRCKLRLGGHSKGGNLAVYAGVFCNLNVQKKIESVWSNDGPGFHSSLLEEPRHQQIADRITTIVPKSSVVGMLLAHDEDYEVVDSDQQGLMQHDGFSWQVQGNHFVHLRNVDRHGQIHDQVMREWLQNMNQEQREKFTDGLFNVLEAGGAKTLSDLKEEGFKAAGAMIKAMKSLDKETREALNYAMKLLFRSNWKAAVETIQQEVEELQQGTLKSNKKNKQQKKAKKS